MFRHWDYLHDKQFDCRRGRSSHFQLIELFCRPLAFDPKIVAAFLISSLLSYSLFFQQFPYCWLMLCRSFVLVRYHLLTWGWAQAFTRQLLDRLYRLESLSLLLAWHSYTPTVMLP